jgi:hypothetical protein
MVRLLVIRCKYLHNARYAYVQVHYCVHKNQSQRFSLSQLNPVHGFISHFLGYVFNFTFTYTRRSVRLCQIFRLTEDNFDK